MPREEKPMKNYLQARAWMAKLFFVIFYAVGIFGMLVHATKELFMQLIPFALILSFLGLLLFHSFRKDRIDSYVFLSIYALAFGIEALGVSTKIIFGSYEYGPGLGTKFLDTPLIIGINWLFLVYATSSVFAKTSIHPVFKIIFASIFMVAYDIVLEQVAPQMNMWYWKDNSIPLQNYISWFFLAVIFHTMIKVFRVNTSNKLAITLLSCQFIFFLVLSIFYK